MKHIRQWLSRYYCIILGLFTLLFIITAPAGCDARQDSDSRPWVLVWEDNFTGSAVNTVEWRPAEQGLNYNNEDQAYIKTNVSVDDSIEDGVMVLTAKKEPWTGRSNRADNPSATVTREYTSGEANTKRSWTYGRFEARARIPATQGVLAAIWMTPLDGDWPPELDIMEILGHAPATVYFTNHYGTSQSHQMNGGNYTGTADFSADFHIYALEWESGILRWYVDGVKCFESRAGVPKEPFILRLSLPVGPDWEGNPDTASVFPQRMEIDWVRVYQRER